MVAVFQDGHVLCSNESRSCVAKYSFIQGCVIDKLTTYIGFQSVQNSRSFREKFLVE